MLYDAGRWVPRSETCQFGEHYQWRATDLKGFPIRTAAVDGTYEQRFTKVELKTPDAKLFETPANCKSMPAVGSPTPPPKAAP